MPPPLNSLSATRRLGLTSMWVLPMSTRVMPQPQFRSPSMAHHQARFRQFLMAAVRRCQTPTELASRLRCTLVTMSPFLGLSHIQPSQQSSRKPEIVN